MSNVNVDVSGLRIMKNRENRIALEYYRGSTRSRYIGFSESGPCKYEVGVQDFLEQFKRPVDTKKTIAQNIMTMLRAARDAYLPDDGVNAILLEAYQLAVLGTTVQKADMKALCAYYNDLVLGVGFRAKPLKKFASKADAAEKLQEVHDWTIELTEFQQRHKADNAAAASRRLSGLDTLRSRVADTMKTNGAARTERKAQPAKPIKEKTAKPARGQGIGAFCCALIVKGKSNEEVLTAVKKQFPGAKTSQSSIAWYRNDLKNSGAA